MFHLDLGLGCTLFLRLVVGMVPKVDPTTTGRPNLGHLRRSNLLGEFHERVLIAEDLLAK